MPAERIWPQIVQYCMGLGNVQIDVPVGFDAS